MVLLTGLALAVLGAVGAVHHVAPDLNGKVATDGACGEDGRHHAGGLVRKVRGSEEQGRDWAR